MARLLEAFKRIFSGSKDDHLSAGELEVLRADFRERYHNFKLLLAANNKALEIMSDMEEAAGSGRPFGMSFIRANCTAISVNVYQIVKKMEALAPGKYDDLSERFKAIQESINQLLAANPAPPGERLVIPLDEVDKDLADQVGAKMANVGEMKSRLGLPVPEGFVISARAYQRFFEHNDLQAEIYRRVQAATLERMDQAFALSSDIQQLVIKAQVPPDLAQAIHEAYAALAARTHAGVTVSMRSSALGEDAAGTSFAGQYRSQLNVNAEHLIEAYKEIVASKYSLQAVTYRNNRGIRDEDVAMCVGCMAMVPAKAGGVVYTRNALNIRDQSIHVTSVWGLPKSVVDGSADCDLFVLDRSPQPQVIERRIGFKERKFVCYPEEGVCRLDLTEGPDANLPSLGDAEASRVAVIARQLEEYYGEPLDIEWAMDEQGVVYLLQCRPLKQFKGAECSVSAQPVVVEGAKALLTGGVTASPGVAAGPVHWVRKDRDALTFPQGAVLVVAQSLPRWAALLSRAAAVVALQGGVAGHLANVAREFEVPALFGLPGLEQALADGQLVTVDAQGLAIYEGRVESLLALSSEKKNLMAGSPVHNTLLAVMGYIAPLTLIDPDSPAFKPANCQTLHDLTRFCHEKSVHEMFSFGKNHHFNERASRQLYYRVPMQWWIINLDDGLKEEDGGKYVRLENIDCLPMLALWEGMVAVPWEGPPPVNARGMASIFFQATTNKSLETSVKTNYANRNYFMISKNFMSLYSRFGFHFSTIETMVSERATENYVSFSFKGGAANFERKLARVHFVAEILEEYGFRVQIKEDAAFARQEGLEQAAMEDQLKMLGYLIIHTRQLDMVMGDAGAVSHFRAKMRRDLQETLGVPPPRNGAALEAQPAHAA